MDDTKREELEKACKKEKDHKVWARMVAVRMVQEGSLVLEVLPQTTNFVPRKGEICRDHA